MSDDKVIGRVTDINEDLTGMYISGSVASWPFAKLPVVDLPAPTKPDKYSTFMLFEWGEYDARGGMDDLSYTGTFKECINRKTEDCAMIVAMSGSPIKLFEWVEREFDGSDHTHFIRGWKPVSNE